nr:O-fucosyltransferase 16 [Ipomoea batatas]
MQIETFSSKNRGYQAETTIVTYCQGGKDCDDRSKVRILLTFGQHGRELITTELALRILSILSDEEFLPKQYPLTLNNTLDKLVIKIVPMENVNGRKLVEKGELCERRNGRGVDLNRNWSVDWGKKEKDYDPYEENPGTSPFSEPETQLMRKLSTSFEPHIWALFMPYDHKNTTPDGFLSQRMKMMLEKLNHFHLNNRCLVGSGGGSVGYLAHGTATDYMYDIVRVPMAFTFEIYGDPEASSKDCFKMFNPTSMTTFNKVLNEWSAVFFTMFSISAHQIDEFHSNASASSSFEKWVSIDDYLNGYLMERRSRYGKKMEVLELGMQEIRTYFRRRGSERGESTRFHMASHRRRHQYTTRVRFLIPAISAISGLILLLFFFLFLLAPPLTDNHQLQLLRRHISVNEGVINEIGVPVFNVPVRISGTVHDRDLWRSKNAKFFHGCSNSSSKFAKAKDITHPNRYLLIATSGGLNQQRTGITDAVVAARILNATLVVPTLDKKSFWKDSRQVVENSFVYAHCLSYTKVVRLTKFDYRLSNRLQTELQKLRCRVNYHALKFADPILEMGKELVQRMRLRSKHYITLHLRFEPDMLAFSGCYYGGGDKEITELGKIRKRWKTLHSSNPDRMRRQGRCPLTPEEVGLMLRALGYGRDAHIYVASGEVYGGEETLAPLKALFPNFHSKDTITTKEELAPFSRFSSRMAALDFIVCDESDVFVTNNNGNMAKILAGRRRYFGHKPTIRPNAKKLWRLFLNRNNMTWEEFASRLRTFQKGFMGEPKEVRPGRGEFHENPSTCICEDSGAKAEANSDPQRIGNEDIASQKETEDHNADNEPEISEPEDEEDGLEGEEFSEALFNVTDYDTSISEEPELEEMLSD